MCPVGILQFSETNQNIGIREQPDTACVIQMQMRQNYKLYLLRANANGSQLCIDTLLRPKQEP
jgi:hypothetical protein